MKKPPFETSVFINCPFDKEFEAILQAILFSISYLGYSPCIALESQNSAETRIEKIRHMIEECKYSVMISAVAKLGKKASIID